MECKEMSVEEAKSCATYLDNLDINYGLYQPIDYILESGGKNTRGLVIKYVQNLLNNDNNSFTQQISSDINLLHNASLIIDDIQDESTKRRGRDAAHIKYGLASCINSAYLQCFKILRHTGEDYPHEIREEGRSIFIKYFELMHIGQGLDIEWTKNGIIPTVDEFNVMMDYKTGSGFMAPIELCILSLKFNDRSIMFPQENLIELGRLMGRFFQIRDDYINITCPKYWRLKTFCEDFDEKKVSYLFTLLKHYDSTDDTYKYLRSVKTLTTKDKIILYNNMYSKGILQQVFMILDKYKSSIIESERKITRKNETSSFLNMFFEKLDYNLPIEPEKVKQIALLSNF